MSVPLTDAELTEILLAYNGPPWKMGVDLSVVRLVDEVQRLRAERAEAETLWLPLVVRESRRLRAVLTDIAEGAGDPNPLTVPVCLCPDIARDALSGDGDA